MTVDFSERSASRIADAAQAYEAAQALAEQFAVGAADRDRDRHLPFEQIEQLSASGLLAITVPVEFGGADLPPSAVAKVISTLAAADPNIAQIPHSHFVYLNLLRLAADEAQKATYFGQVLNGGRLANAQSERGGKNIADISTTVTPVDDHFVVSGEKFYCTGSLFADTLAVLTRLDDPNGESGLAAGEYVAFLPKDTAGVTVVDDWNGIGQRTTGSGTVRFDNVVVQRDQLVARAGALDAPAGYGAFAQLLHVAIDAGIARGALEAAAHVVRTKSRPWVEAKVDRAIDDPLVIQRFGELAVLVSSAEATLAVAGEAVDRAITERDQSVAAEASLAVATAKVVSDRAATEVSSALFEVSGTRSAAEDLNLHHFWRNARTHTLHDPVRWKYQNIGRSLLHQEAPPQHGTF